MPKTAWTMAMTAEKVNQLRKSIAKLPIDPK
jgi:hypothetical protein